MAITQKLCISDPILVKSKCFWQWNIYLKNCKQTADKNVNRCSIPLTTLALPIGGQKCLVYESYLFNISKMDLGHPVINSLNNHSLCGKIQAKILTPNSDYPTHLVWYFFNFQSSHVILTSFWTSMAWTHHSPMSITQH